MNRLSSEQIHAIRAGYKLSIRKFGLITGIGWASLQRWESGKLVPNLALDNLLYLLTFEENLYRLIERSETN